MSVEDASGEVVEYASTSAVLSVRWSGFVESCSGVRDYHTSLIENGTTLWAASASATDASELLVPANVTSSLRHGGRYRHTDDDHRVRIYKNLLGMWQMKVLSTGRSVPVRQID